MRNHKKRQFITIAILSIIFLIEVIFYLQTKVTYEAFNVNLTTKTELKNELIIALFMDNIIADSNKYYNTNYYTNELEYFSYEFKIKDIKYSDTTPYLYITFETTPMAGAHWPVGDDEITYKVDSTGVKTLERFTHKKSYDIPPWLQKDLIKPLPQQIVKKL